MRLKRCILRKLVRDEISLMSDGSVFQAHAQCTGVGCVQARPHGVQLSAQQSTPVPRRPLPVCLQCRLQTTSSRSEVFSSCLTIVSSVRSAGFFCGRPAICNWLPDSLRDPPSAETPSSVR